MKQRNNLVYYSDSANSKLHDLKQLSQKVPQGITKEHSNDDNASLLQSLVDLGIVTHFETEEEFFVMVQNIPTISYQILHIDGSSIHLRLKRDFIPNQKPLIKRDIFPEEFTRSLLGWKVVDIQISAKIITLGGKDCLSVDAKEAGDLFVVFRVKKKESFIPISI